MHAQHEPESGRDDADLREHFPFNVLRVQLHDFPVVVIEWFDGDGACEGRRRRHGLGAAPLLLALGQVDAHALTVHETEHRCKFRINLDGRKRVIHIAMHVVAESTENRRDGRGGLQSRQS